MSGRFARTTTLVLLLGFVVAACGGRNESAGTAGVPMASPEEAAAVAERFVGAWVSARFTEAHTELGQPIAGRETAARLEERWNTLTQAHGPLVAVGQGETGVEYAMAVVSIPVRLERALLDVKIVVNERNQVDDFLLSLSPD